MERPSKIQQLYGYSVCLVAVITMLVTIPGMLDAIARRQAPLQAPMYGIDGGTISETFEQHKLANPSYLYVARQGTFGEKTAYDSLSEDQARQRYEYKRTERIAGVRHQTSRELLSDVVLLLVSLVLFVSHWRWLRHLERTAPASAV